MQKIFGALAFGAGLAMLIFPAYIPIANHMLPDIYIRVGGALVGMLGGFLFWADQG